MFQFPFLGLARLPAYSQECPLLHPGSIHVLNLIYSIQHISHTLKSYIDITNQNKSCNKKEPAELNGDGRSLLHAHHEQTHTETEHQEIHKTENAHECTEYGKAFLKKSQLNEHKIIHTGKKPHGCSLCGKTFFKKFKLTEHQRTYKGEKLHECCECGRAFLREF